MWSSAGVTTRLLRLAGALKLALPFSLPSTSSFQPEPLLAADTDSMSLLDYAGSRLGRHLAWPEARPVLWCELPAPADLDPAVV